MICTFVPENMLTREFFTDIPEEKQQFLADIKDAKSIVISTHQNPDGDAFGSSLGLYWILKNLRKKVSVISPTNYAEYIAWLPGVDDVLVYESDEQDEANELIKQADVFFCLDFSALSRLDKMGEIVLNSDSKKVLIDHHEKPEEFPDYYYFDINSSSTCELVYLMIEQLGWKNHIDLNSATCLYTGIVTDTGSFKFDSTTSQTMFIAGQFLNYGVNAYQVHKNLFDNESLNKVKLKGFILSENLNYLDEFKTSYMKVSKDDLKRHQSSSGDTEGIVNYGLSIKGAVLSAIFVERENHIKISFRSSNDFSVSEFARKYFSGGGHQKAAGGRSDKSLDETVSYFLEKLSENKIELNK